MPVRHATPLPEPDPAARAHSARVAAAIAAAIDAAGGFVSWRRYMDLALYAPGLGYYVAGARKLGADGDFVTAPEMTPLFGAAIANNVAAVLASHADAEVVELGAGTGKLAVDVLAALDSMNRLPTRYAILELGPELRERQRATLGRLGAGVLSRVEWLSEPPREIRGCVLMNEVLDAVPPHLVLRRVGQWFERGVSHRDGAFAWSERPLDDPRVRALAAQRFPADVDYESEINVAAEALVEDFARRLASGAMLLMDYGFVRREYYHPQRRYGTWMGHYRHRAHADPFLWPGLSDLTAHVDFTAVAEAGERAGLSVAGFVPQSTFLMSSGILDRLNAIGAPDSAGYLREASAVQKLLSPSEMGESFKVLALAREPELALPGFALADQTHRL